MCSRTKSRSASLITYLAIHAHWHGRVNRSWIFQQNSYDYLTEFISENHVHIEALTILSFWFLLFAAVFTSTASLSIIVLRVLKRLLLALGRQYLNFAALAIRQRSNGSLCTWVSWRCIFLIVTNYVERDTVIYHHGTFCMKYASITCTLHLQ